MRFILDTSDKFYDSKLFILSYIPLLRFTLFFFWSPHVDTCDSM